MPRTFTDPTDIAQRPVVIQPPDVSILDKLNVGPVNPADQWLFEHRRNIESQPYADVDADGNLRMREGVDLLYPGMEPLISKARKAGVSDDMIAWKIREGVALSLDAGVPDDAIEEKLFKDQSQLGLPRAAKEYAARTLLPQKVLDYLSWGAKEKEYRSVVDKVYDEAERGKVDSFYADRRATLVNDIAATVAKGFGAVTFGLGPLAYKAASGEQIPEPQTTAGAIASQGANLAGFLLGPYKAASAIWGSAAAPTATGLRAVAEIMAQGGARLGTATFLADAVPAFEQSDSLTEATKRLVGNAATSTIAGSLFPVAGAVENKALRIAVGMAISDKMRAGTGEWFTIDDVVKGVADGTIDKGELAERSYAYLLDLYFMAKTPSMKGELVARRRNAMVEEMMRTNPAEAEQMIVALGKQGLVPSVDAKQLEGLNWNDVRTQFGGVEGFKAAYRALSPQQVAIAKGIIQGAKAQPSGGLLPSSKAVIKSQGQALADAMKVEQMYNRSDAMLAALHKGNLKAATRELARLTWDSSANVKSELLKKGGAAGKEAVIHHTLARGASEKADMLWRKSVDDIYGDLSKADHILLDRIIGSRRTMAIGAYKKNHKFTEGLTADQHENFLKSTPTGRLSRLNAKADQYFKVMRGQLDALKSEGLLSQEQYDGLVSKGDYSRRNVIDYIDPERTVSIGGRKITVRDSGIDSLKEGSENVIEQNSMLLMREVIGRTEARILRNRANQALYELAKNKPANGIVTLWAPKKAGLKTPPGQELVSAMVGGKQQQMLMPSELAREWVLSDPMVNRQWTQMVGWLSGANILRPMATGLNPEFAITNMPRDIMHAWLTTGEYSTVLPVGMGQMARDFAAVAKDALTRTGRYSDYIMEGGGMSFLTHQGRVKQGAKPGGVLDSFQKYLGYLGETSELWTRLALRERAIRNGKPSYEATYVSRNYLDFAQGGSFAKAIDAGIPYLNASIQGTRGLFRATKETPLTTTAKVAQLGGLAVGMYYANSRCNKDCWDSVSDYDKANYFIVTTPLTYTDETGQEIPIYFKIAKDQTQKVIYSMFEALGAHAVGDPVNFDEIAKSAKDFAAIVPSANVPPILDASVAYFLNYDLWYGKKVWGESKGQVENVKSTEEWTAQTDPVAVAVGRSLGLSPERLQRAVEQFTTRNNVYTQLVGYGLGQIVEKLPEQERQETMQEMVRQMPFLRRAVGFGNPDFEAMKENREIAIEYNTERFVVSRQLDAIADQVVNGQVTKADAVRFIMEQQPEERKRLMQRLQTHVSYGKLQNRSWWINLSETSPEAAATMYWFKYERSDSEHRQQMQQTLMQLHDPRIATARFMKKLAELKREKR